MVNEIRALDFPYFWFRNFSFVIPFAMLNPKFDNWNLFTNKNYTPSPINDFFKIYLFDRSEQKWVYNSKRQVYCIR